jgi:hypothetical protein
MATNDETFLTSEITARWAYSEIVDGTLAHIYDSLPWIKELRAIRTAGRKFAALSEEERYALAFQCVAARPMLMVYMAGVDEFRQAELGREELATVLVPPIVSPELTGLVSFERYITSVPPLSLKDARNVQADPASYRGSSEPLTLGRFGENHVLLDGYHRAASFWKSAPQNATVHAFVPSGIGDKLGAS